MQCVAKKADGHRCLAHAVTGATTCRMHLGNAPHIQRAAARKAAKAKAEAQIMKHLQSEGISLEGGISPHQALMESMMSTAAVVQYIRKHVSKMEEDELVGMMVVKQVIDADGGVTVTKASVKNIWLELLGEWEDRSSKISKLAIDAGVAERAVRIVEQQASLLAGAVWGILNDLGVEQDSSTIQIVRRHMMALEQ